MSMVKLITIVSLCVAAASISGCASTTAGGAVGAKRSQLMLISSAELDQMAEQTYAKLKTKFRVRPQYCSVNIRLHTPFLVKLAAVQAIEARSLSARFAQRIACDLRRVNCAV